MLGEVVEERTVCGNGAYMDFRIMWRTWPDATIERGPDPALVVLDNAVVLKVIESCRPRRHHHQRSVSPVGLMESELQDVSVVG
jgi:hypothetical protein